jgi:hypothetical protein
MATACEVAAVTVADYDSERQRVWLAGSAARFTPRWATLLRWDAAAIERRVAALGSEPTALLVCTGSRAPSRAGAAISMALRKVLNRAGLKHEPRGLPGSFRAWGGRRLYDDGADIEEVARRLGVRTLDNARRIIGLADPEPDTPPAHRRPH